MPKSRRRKKPEGRTVKMPPELAAAMEQQLAAFRAKFGREPGPDDPVFFDLDKDVPTPIDEQPAILEVMSKANLPQSFPTPTGGRVF